MKLLSEKKFNVALMVAQVKQPECKLLKMDYRKFKKLYKELFVRKRLYKYACVNNPTNGVSKAYCGTSYESVITGKITGNDMELAGVMCNVCEDDDYTGEGNMACIVTCDDVEEFAGLAD